MAYFIYIAVPILAALLTLFVQKNKASSLDTQLELTQAMSSAKISLRPFTKLGGTNYGWLNTHHHFSFADYYDPNRQNWGALRVINDDIVAPGGGVPDHPHRSMEIITYILEPNFHPATNQIEGGAGCIHGDNAGNKGITEAGDVQVMSVGYEGVIHNEGHSDRNSKQTSNVLQIWIVPDERIKKTTWGTRHFPRDEISGEFIVFASGFKADQENKGALPINSLSRVVGIRVRKGKTSTYKLDANRMAYAVVTKGNITLNGLTAHAHDAVAIETAGDLSFASIKPEEDAEILLVDTHPV